MKSTNERYQMNEEKKHISCKTVICYILLLLSIPAYSQEWKEDLLAMNKAYINAKSFQMNVRVKSFATINDVHPLLDYKGKVASSNGNYFTDMMGRTTISNKQCLVVVDTKQKMILYKKNKGDSKPQSGFSIAQLDSAFILMDKNVKVSYLVNTTIEKKIQLVYKNNAIDKIELSIDPSKNTITQLVYYYNTNKPEYTNSAAKVIVVYTDVELNKIIDDSYFSVNKFISVKKDKIIPLKNYANYQVINQDEAQTP